VARYEFRKGYHILKPVLEKLIAEGADFNIDIVGDIPDNLKIKNDAVTYHGNLKAEKLKSLKESCEILVVCSLAEGFPTILVEAMARGLAPLASDVGAVSAVVNNENGWLIEPGSEEDLFQAMTLAITTSADALSDKQKKSRDAISRDFKWDSMFNVLVSHLELIVNDYRKRPSR
jgi:glycosyltransferase involved in cell wall biosynthesis